MVSQQTSERESEGSISRRGFMHGLGAVGLSMLGGLGLAACSGELRRARTQYPWINSSEFNGFYAADVRGFYEDGQLSVELLAGGPSVGTLEIVDARQAEVALCGSASAFIHAVAGGSQSVVFASVCQRSPAGLMYLADNPIATPRDAVGKRIGLQDGATNDWQTVCSANGLDWQDDVEIVSVGWDPFVLADGLVDGYWCYSTNQPGILRREGFDVGVLAFNDWGLRSYADFALVHRDYLAANRRALVNWLRATIRGWVYANSHVREITAHLVDDFGDDYGLGLSQQLEQASAQIDYMVSGLTNQRGLLWFDQQTWQDNIDQLVELGQLKPEAAPDVDVMTTYEILEAVYSDGIDPVYDPAR